MISESIDTAETLNSRLGGVDRWSNGKNFPIDHLHATVAESRWEYENIQGIYLTNETHVWMAMWMAITNRRILKKRQLGYVQPSVDGDFIGSLNVCCDKSVPEVMCEKGYLYLFEPLVNGDNKSVLDITDVPKQHKVPALLDLGFNREVVSTRSGEKHALVDKSGEQRIIRVDEWQIALTNAQEIIPDEELIIEKSVIVNLMGRVALTQIELGENYIF